MQGQPKYSPLAPVVTTEMVGTWIDGSHWSADDLNRAVITKAVEYGAEFRCTDDEMFFGRVAVYLGQGNAWADQQPDDGERLTELADAAVDWMNRHLVYHHQLAFTVDENSLMLEKIEDSTE